MNITKEAFMKKVEQMYCNNPEVIKDVVPVPCNCNSGDCEGWKLQKKEG